MKAITNLTLAVLTLLAAGACNKHQIDNEKSNYNAIMEISASAPSVVLDEARPNEVALTVSWTPAFDYGSDFIMTYEYSMDVSASKASPISEYEDEGRFTRSYTHKELQDMLVGHFGQLTSTVVPLKFNVTASYSGPRIVIPDMSSVVVTVKTYGPKQFAADKVFMGGTAVGATPVELAPSPKNAALYVYNGNLAAGKLNFPVIYGEDASEAAYWLIPSSESYRVTLNFNTKTVTVIPSSQIFESDALYLAGSSLEEEVLLPPTVENSAVYAFHGALKAGTLYIPVEFEEARTLSIVPASDSHEIADGTAVSFGQALTSQTSAKYWNIPSDGIYRVVVDTDAKTIAIYSPATDPQNKVVSFNNTVAGINPFQQEVTELWMWGGFNAMDKDPDLLAGFQRQYTLKQSLANPYVFVYYGEELPRKSGNYNSKNSVTGATSGPAWLTFLVTNIQNNVYAYGSMAAAKRNSYTGTVEPALGDVSEIRGGQGDNRYAYFVIPEGANYVEVNIDAMTVVFDKR